MALQGRIEAIGLADVLQLLASSNASGKLSLTQAAGWGVVVLRHGKVIYAGTSSVREAMGNILLCLGLITEQQLEEGLRVQAAAEREHRLGAILVEMGALSAADLERVIRDQIRASIAELVGWSEGFFRFQRLELPDRGEIEVEAADFLASEGLATDQLLLDLQGALAEEEDVPSAARESSLNEIMTEFHSPSFNGEITMRIVGAARQVVRRGVLFAATRRGFSGIGQFGLTPPAGAPADFVRQINVLLAEPTVLREAISRKTVHRTALEENAANRQLMRQLGGGWPAQVVVAPLIVSGRVLMVLYGDNLPSGDPIPPGNELQLVLVQAGLAMEEALLARRRAHARRLRGGAG